MTLKPESRILGGQQEGLSLWSALLQGCAASLKPFYAASQGITDLASQSWSLGNETSFSGTLMIGVFLGYKVAQLMGTASA